MGHAFRHCPSGLGLGYHEGHAYRKCPSTLRLYRWIYSVRPNGALEQTQWSTLTIPKQQSKPFQPVAPTLAKPDCDSHLKTKPYSPPNLCSCLRCCDSLTTFAWHPGTGHSLRIRLAVFRPGCSLASPDVHGRSGSLYTDGLDNNQCN